MNRKDALIIKSLEELGLRTEKELTPEQEQLLSNALDPEEAYYDKLLDIFKQPSE